MFKDVLIIMLMLLIIFLIFKYIKLNNSHKNLKMLFNDVGDLVCFKDKNGDIVSANKGFCHVFNIDESFTGMTMDELKTLNEDKNIELEKCIQGDRETIKQKKTLVFEETFKMRCGVKKNYKVIKTPVYDESKALVGIVCVARDITDKLKRRELERVAKDREKSLEKLEQYTQIKTEFFANLSHEFRTPLNLILSAIKMKDIYRENYKNNGSLNLEKHEYYSKVIKQNTLRLIKLVNNIIDISKYETNYLQVNLESCNIISFIENIVLSVNEFAKEKNLTLIFDTNIEECIIETDLDKMERIILNLLSNSVKFTPSGGKILVNIISNENELEIYVSDTGIGIPNEKREFIFERFFQVDKSISRNREGSGIGLSLVKAFVEVLNGEVTINDSNDSNGVEFKIKLPKSASNILKRNIAIRESINVEVINIEFSDIYD
ncbi:MAG: ATP-binding protein [Sarcina sp.]